MSVRSIIIGTHQYQWATNIAAYLFDKYVGLPLLYVGDHVEGVLYEGLEFMQVPCFSEGVWPWKNHFARGLNSIFENFKDDLILLLLPDQWILEPVSLLPILALGEYMERRPCIVRGNLAQGQALYDHGYVFDCHKGYEIWSVSPTNPHASLHGAITFCPTLWNPRARELFEPHWTLQECENLGTEVIAAGLSSVISVGIKPAPIRYAHVLHHAQPHTVNLMQVPMEDREIARAYIPDVWSVSE
jgi:hypothetical protein